MKRAAQLTLGLLLALASQRAAVAQTATVITDQADYAPGTIVTITGSGWRPGETVTLNLVETPLIDTHPDLYATADANGDIFNNQFSPDSYDGDISFTLTATGGTSGLQARTTFTDSTSLKTVAVGNSDPCVNSLGRFGHIHRNRRLCREWQLHRPLSITTALPTGVTASFSPSTLTGVASNPDLTSTLTITTTGSTPAGYKFPIYCAGPRYWWSR